MTAQSVAKCTSRRAVFHSPVVVSVHGHVGDRQWLWCPWCEIQLSILSRCLTSKWGSFSLHYHFNPLNDWANMRPEVSQLDVPVAVHDEQFGSDGE